jgi:hypothetical protein
MELLQF